MKPEIIAKDENHLRELTEDWKKFLNLEFTDIEINELLKKIESSEFFQNNPNDFFKSFILKPIENSSNKKYINNKLELGQLLEFFLNKSNGFLLDEKTAGKWFKILSNPKFVFLEKTFFSNFLNSMSLENSFEFYNHSSFNNPNHLKRFHEKAIQFLENKKISWEELQHHVENIKDSTKHELFINQLFCTTSSNVQKACHNFYWHKISHEKQLEITKEMLISKDVPNLNEYKDFIKESLLQNIDNQLYIDKLTKSINKEKFDIVLECLNELKENGVSNDKANNVIFRIIDKSLLDKRKVVNHFLEVKENKPDLIPSEMLILYAYRSILVYKKEESIPMVKEVFNLAKRLGEDNWLMKKLYDFDTEYHFGATFTLGNNPGIKKRLMDHLHDFLQVNLPNTNAVVKKPKI